MVAQDDRISSKIGEVDACRFDDEGITTKRAAAHPHAHLARADLADGTGNGLPDHDLTVPVAASVTGAIVTPASLAICT